jgi:putative ABC transport system permease protein
MISEYFSIALKNIRSRKLRSWLTMLGILIGIMSIVSLIALGEGLRVAVSSQFGGLAPDAFNVVAGQVQGPPGSGNVVLFTDNEVDKVSSVREVELAAGRNLAFTSLEHSGSSTFVSVINMPAGEKGDLVKYITNLKIEEGRFIRDGEPNRVIIGYSVANRESLSRPIQIDSRVKINGKDFTVVGIAEKAGNFAFDSSIIISDDDFFRIFDNEKNTYSFIVGKKRDAYTMDETVDAVEKALRNERKLKEGRENFQISTPQGTIESLNSTLFAVQLFVYIIAGISILVGGIGIMTTMYTTVVERTKEIGIMKAIGAKNENIFFIFFIESGFIGLLGGLFGVILGAGTAYGLAYVGSLFLGDGLIQAQLSIWLLVGALIFSFLLGSFFGTFPALRAAKMNPVDALTHVK